MQRSRLSLIAVFAGVALAFTGFDVSPSGASPSPSPVSFTTQGSTTWKVPAGVTQLRVVATGAKGADTPPLSFYRSTGGKGSRVSATLDVTPGTTVQINVGVGGGTSKFGGNGGGASDVRAMPFTLTDRVVVAAGGGGAGADSSQCGIPGSGGTGGGGAGAPGPAQHDQCSPGGSGGKGGTASAGGSGGDAFYVTVHHSGDGAFGTGGIALGDDATDAVGGGGGGGWYGGGAGGALYQSFAGSGGGGGGGSDHVAVEARDVTIADGVNSSGAAVTITPLTTPTVAFTSLYNPEQVGWLHQLASRTHRSDAEAQHDATLSLARRLDWLTHHGSERRRDNRGDADVPAPGGVLRVTSVYTTSEAALVSRVARHHHVSESTFQRFAVLVVSQARGR